MEKKLFLLDGMALVYRAHFALINRPIFNSKGVNTSALYGFTQTLLEIIRTQQPTHLAVALDTSAPTQRHKDFPEYKAQRQEMPEDLSQAMPHVCRMVEAFNIPLLVCDGYEADDIIGTLVRCAEKHDFTTFMVTPDKDFGQLVGEKTFLYRPSRMGDGIDILGLPEIRAKWGIENAAQVIDILGLWGDTSDNIPGVPGIGEKTASKLITQYGSIENLLSHTDELKGKLKESLITYREQALLSKKLATIICDAPCEFDVEKLTLREPNKEKLRDLFIEFEFNTIGRRVLGDDFKAGHGGKTIEPIATSAAEPTVVENVEGEKSVAELAAEPVIARENLKTLVDVPHRYAVVRSDAERAALVKRLNAAKSFALSVETNDPEPKSARVVGLSFAFEPHEACFISTEGNFAALVEEFRAPLENAAIEKVGHDLKFDLSVLEWSGVSVRGKLFDTMLAHSLVEPEVRHTIEYLSEVYLSYSPTPMAKVNGEGATQEMLLTAASDDQLCDYACEFVDIALQLRPALEKALVEKNQQQLFYEIEAPLAVTLVAMEREGVRLESTTLHDFSTQLGKEIAEQEKAIYALAGSEFNLNSAKRLGEVLFDTLKISEKAKKTRTGQYATDEQTLLNYSEHEIIKRILEYRMMTKLKSTYVDALPAAIWPRTGRVHTTYQQTATTTGRLNSHNPNLQNIPIRSDRGQEIRKAFVPRDGDYTLLAADYSQIELRILASVSKETAMIEAFRSNADIHTATAARVFGVSADAVTPEMRRKSKMVNFGIAYGISAFGLAQRLGIPRKEAAAIIEQYFAQFPGIKRYMTDTIAFAREKGYVETLTGRRRYLRDIRSSNATTRAGAERNAINMPIQGTAADMIKIAMNNIHSELNHRQCKTRMLLQVHDELVFDLFKTEEKEVLPMVEDKMKRAIELDVPIEIGLGTGVNWLEAH